MEQHNQSFVWIIVLVALVAGALGGYFFGVSQGRTALLSEQKAAEEAKKKAAQEEVAKKANPFAEAEELNPVKSGYENPFEGTETVVNPFRQ